MQTALRFLNRYASLQAIQDIIKKCTNEYMEGIISVSYTHLTLPTILLV